MSNIASALSRPSRSIAVLRERIVLGARKTAVALQVYAERRRLMTLDDATLKDMGFNKGQAQCEADRTFWDVPVDRVRL